ncbi:MAG: helix-turn-helix domain-containing protein [Chloroflexota bacterium]
MTRPGTQRNIPEAAGRRLALSPISFDIIVALAHDPAGLRLTPMANAIGSPVSSVAAALRILLANGLATRDHDVPPQYALSDHPARGSLVEASLLLPEAAHILGILLRTSSAVAFAAVDRDGFVAGLDPAADPTARERLLRSLATIAGSREDAPRVQVADVPELTRLTTVSVGSMARIASAVLLKGRRELVSGGRKAEPVSAEVVIP